MMAFQSNQDIDTDVVAMLVEEENGNEDVSKASCEAYAMSWYRKVNMKTSSIGTIFMQGGYNAVGEELVQASQI